MADTKSEALETVRQRALEQKQKAEIRYPQLLNRR